MPEKGVFDLNWIQRGRTNSTKPSVQTDPESEGGPKKDSGILRGPKTMRFERVGKNRGAAPTARLCKIMNVRPRGFRAVLSSPISQSQLENR